MTHHGDIRWKQEYIINSILLPVMQCVVQALYHKLYMYHICPCLSTVNSENKTQKVSDRVLQCVDGEAGI